MRRQHIYSGDWHPLFPLVVVQTTNESAMDTEKWRDLDYMTKVSVIEHAVNGEVRKLWVAEAFDIPQSVLSTLLWNELDIVVAAVGQ